MKYKKYITIVLFILLLIYICTGYAKGYNKAIAIQEQKQAIEAQKLAVEAMSVPELIEYLAPENAPEIKKVAWCESSYNPQAVGDGGRAKNIMQFHKPTFDQFSKEMGEPLNYDSAYDQIKLADYMWEKDLKSHWTCARITKII